MRRPLLVAAALLTLAVAPPAVVPRAWAQPYPTRPIQFVVPFATGGPTDTAIRVIQPQLAASLGVPVVLVNKPGGGGGGRQGRGGPGPPRRHTPPAPPRPAPTLPPPPP